LLLDIDECADKNAQLCEGDMKCFNSPGSFKCECDHGFLPDGYKTCKGWKFVMFKLNLLDLIDYLK